MNSVASNTVLAHAAGNEVSAGRMPHEGAPRTSTNMLLNTHGGTTRRHPEVIRSFSSSVGAATAGQRTFSTSASTSGCIVAATRRRVTTLCPAIDDNDVASNPCGETTSVLASINLWRIGCV